MKLKTWFAQMEKVLHGGTAKEMHPIWNPNDKASAKDLHILKSLKTKK